MDAAFDSGAFVRPISVDCNFACPRRTSLFYVSDLQKGNIDIMKNLFLIGSALLTTCMTFSGVKAAEPGWSPVIVATGDYRQQLEKTPIVRRPYRPFHFYGNTIRRRHYRGTAIPTPRDLVTTGLIPVMLRN